MERVAFLVEGSADPVRCLLNPETLVVRRLAGVRSRRSLAGQVSGEGLRDTPLLFTGGGRTEIELDLLFDTSLAAPGAQVSNVRDLTAPLWRLAESSHRRREYRQPPQVRFLWGKHWDIPGIIVAVAERLEQFTSGGAPQRSWLRMRLVRVNEEAEAAGSGGERPRRRAAARPLSADPGGALRVHSPLGGMGLSGARDLPGAAGIWAATLTAGGIIGSALSETYTAAALRAIYASALEVVGQAARFVVEKTGELVRAVGESAAVRTLVAVVNKAAEAVVAVATAAGREVHRVVSQAAATIADTAREARTALGELAVQAREAVTERFQAVVDELGPVVEAIGEAADHVSAAVQEAFRDLADSHVARAVVAAGRDLVAAVRDFIETPGFVSEAVAAISGRVERAWSVIQREASAMGGAAMAQVREAVAALEPLVTKVITNADVVLSFAAAVAVTPIGAAVLDIAHTGVALARAGGVIATAVRARAAQVAAGAGWQLREIAGRSRLLLDDLHDHEAAAVKKAFDEAQRAGTALLDGVLDFSLPSLWPAMAAVGPELEHLWQAGEGRAVRRITEEMRQTGVAAKGVAAAGEALQAVEPSVAQTSIEQDLAALQAQLAVLAAAPETAEPAAPETPADTAPAEEAPLGEEAADLSAAEDSLRQFAVHAQTIGVPEEAAELEALADSAAELSDAVAALQEAEASPATVAAAMRGVEMAQEASRRAVDAVAGKIAASVQAAGKTAEGQPGAALRYRPQEGERLDQVAFSYYQDPAFWRPLAEYNEIDHPLRRVSGELLQIPPVVVSAVATGPEEPVRRAA